MLSLEHSKLNVGLDGLDWMDGIGLSYTAVTPRASLTSDANNKLLAPLRERCSSGEEVQNPIR